MKNNKTYRVYGINSALSTLDSNDCKIKEILLIKKSKAFNSNQINKRINISYLKNKIKIVESLDLNNNIENRSQGIMILFEYLGIKDSVEDLLDNNTKNSCVLILDQLEDPQNLGQIIRTCECAGVNKIILTQKRSVKLSDISLQVSQGAFGNISFYICTNLRMTLDILKNNGYWLMAFENSIKADEWYKIDLKGKVGIILGSEGKGIRRLTLENSDFISTIPMQGKINSLNVSATCSAILFERLRQILN